MSSLISVIVPVYNAEHYLRKCLDSVLEQSYEHLEVILVNDGSTDASPSICDEYARSDDRIKVIHKQNAGPGAARQDGVRIASGEFIGFVDADDYIDRDMYSSLIGIAAAGDFDIVQCGFRQVDMSGTTLKVKEMASCEVHGSYECALYHAMQEKTTNFLWNKLYRRELFEKVTFPDLYFGEDTCVLTQLYTYARSVCTIRDPLYNWVMTPQSLCRSPFSEKRLDVVRAGQFMYDFYQEHIPELSPYAAFYICYWSAELYFEVARTEIRGKHQIQQSLVNAFSLYYPLVRKSRRNIRRSRGKRIFVDLFYLSPKLGYLAYRLRH